LSQFVAASLIDFLPQASIDHHITFNYPGNHQAQASSLMVAQAGLDWGLASSLTGIVPKPVHPKTLIHGIQFIST